MLAERRIQAEREVKRLEEELMGAALTVPLEDLVAVVRHLRACLKTRREMADSMNPVVRQADQPRT